MRACTKKREMKKMKIEKKRRNVCLTKRKMRKTKIVKKAEGREGQSPTLLERKTPPMEDGSLN